MGVGWEGWGVCGAVEALLRIVAWASDRLSLCGCSGATLSIRGTIETCL